MTTQLTPDCSETAALILAIESTSGGRLDGTGERHLASCSACARALEREADALGPKLKELSGRHGKLLEHYLLLARTHLEGHAPPEEPVPPSLPDFTILRLLASGGSGDVWLARDEAAPLVVKCVRGASSELELDALKRYRQLADEPEIGLYPIHYIGRCRTSGRLCYSMPCADPVQPGILGTESYEPATLDSLRKSQPLTVDGVLALGQQLLATLEKLHVLGLVHRDVKPSNILRRHGRWLLGDTGLLVHEGQAREGAIGTPVFLPPEERNDHHRADLFSLGKTLYFALCGDLEAFPAPRTEHLRRGSDRRALRRLFRVIHRACEPRPEDRYASASEMRRELSGLGPTGWRSGSMFGVVLLVVIALRWGGVPGVGARAAGGAEGLDTPLAARATEDLRQVGHLELLYQNPDDETQSLLRTGQVLRAGVEFEFEVSDLEREFACLVLAYYVWGERSVSVHLPNGEREAGAVPFLLASEGGMHRFRASSPTPLLCLLLGSDRVLETTRVEVTVDQILDRMAAWPRTAAGLQPGVTRPLRFHGTRILTLTGIESWRGGPEPEPGGEASSAELTELTVRLSEQFEAFDGIRAEVVP